MIIAIDPGKSGGIATENNGIVSTFAMPETEGDVCDLLTTLAATSQPQKIIIEEVGGFTGKGQPGSAMFTFGRGFGFILGVCAARGWRVDLVRPQKWQKALSLGASKNHASKTAWKNHLKARAQQLYPAQSVTLKTADALLLLEYGSTNL